MSLPRDCFVPRENSLPATTVEIREHFYEEVVDLDKLFSPIRKKKNKKSDKNAILNKGRSYNDNATNVEDNKGIDKEDEEEFMTSRDEFLESIHPKCLGALKKGFRQKPERIRFGNNSSRQNRYRRLPKIKRHSVASTSTSTPSFAVDMLKSNYALDQKIQKNLEKANASLQTTLIPKNRLQEYALKTGGKRRSL